ncbi:Lrp/AsnC family transcriptional regulator [Homoserinibacter sp. GY 40078]|uniref:Lrp/AsnC family transcriptional regulator n=1 Tax=Homoserinibacter sp. GY 40078 TaxID=2603275 RepID=UPI0011C7627F|nr:Lrp/AsnC family transcriptional regulator [Homoserinibacter sp. GY 40078]TXK19847.1 Lrp/AsnC family transcriptional regulator [Homoserinibacter sp. GY 40078]
MSPASAEGPDSQQPHSPMSAMTREVLPSTPTVELDEIDLRLLGLLLADPRVSQRQLAREVGMSPPAVGERIARLERQGLVRGYTAIVDWSALGYPGLVYIPMTLTTDAQVPDVVGRLRDIPELTELVIVTGSYDLVARFRIRDHAHLQRLLLDRIWPIRGLQRIETLLGLGELVAERPANEVIGLPAPETSTEEPATPEAV